MTPLAFTVSEAAEALRIGETHLKELIRTQAIDSFTTTDGPRSRRLISRAALERFIAQREALERGEVLAIPGNTAQPRA